jgi:hypothetical protein
MSDEYFKRIGRTNWNAYRLDEIWQMLRDENGRISWTQYYAWRRMATLCEEQADQLEKALRQLTERWPTRPGTAAHAFQLQVEALIASMRHSVEAANANRDAVHKITFHLGAARGQVANLLDQARQYASAEARLVDTIASMMGPGPHTNPGSVPAALPAPPPDEWQRQLDQQARQIMAETDATIAAEATRLHVPTPYTFLSRFREATEAVGGGVDGPSWTSQLPGTAIGDLHLSVPSTAPPEAAATPSPAVDSLVPILDGSVIEPKPIRGNGPAGVGGFGAPAAPSLNASLGLLPSEIVVRTSSAHANRAPSGSTAPHVKSVGAKPGGSAPATARAAGPAGMPVAPMIPPVGARPAGGPGGVAPAGRPAVPGRRRANPDPNDPWAVKLGGPAVLEPAPEPGAHDPGPGVIGLDR